MIRKDLFAVKGYCHTVGADCVFYITANKDHAINTLRFHKTDRNISNLRLVHPSQITVSSYCLYNGEIDPKPFASIR